LAERVDVVVQEDYLERLTSARPTQAVAELIWNAVDAAHQGYRILLALGGSWKRAKKLSAGEGRVLHGDKAVAGFAP